VFGETFWIALNPLEPIGSYEARNFVLCKKQVNQSNKEPQSELVSPKSKSGWKAWLNKSLSFKILSHWLHVNCEIKDVLKFRLYSELCSMSHYVIVALAYWSVYVLRFFIINTDERWLILVLTLEIYITCNMCWCWLWNIWPLIHLAYEVKFGMYWKHKGRVGFSSLKGCLDCLKKGCELKNLFVLYGP